MSREDIHRLWDELADFGADCCAEAAAHLMKSLSERGGAWNATWAGGTRLDGGAADDPLKGWRVSAIQALYPIAPYPDEGHFWEVVKPWEKRQIDPSYLLPMRGLGTFRTYSLRRDLPESWFDSPFYQRHYGSVGTYDAVWIGFPLNEDCESHFAFYSRERMTDAAITLFAETLRGIKWFHRNLLLSHGLLVACAPLAQAERRVLRLLLTDATEKQMASQLNLTPATVHQYVIGIYRKFGVRSRPALMRLWLSSAS
jgi:DNA-binding CsgD family transcriptional regulator